MGKLLFINSLLFSFVHNKTLEFSMPPHAKIKCLDFIFLIELLDIQIALSILLFFPSKCDN